MIHRKLFALALVFVLGSGLAARARAELLEFTFSTTVDGTPLGLAASQPVTLRYRYDPVTVPLVFELGMPVVRTYYAPVEGTLTVGSDVVVLDGELILDNDNSGADSFTFLAASNVGDTSISGSVNGTALRSCQIFLLDQSQPPTMLASFAPPATTSFAADATLVRLDFRANPPFIGTRDFAPGEFGSFSFTVPEPDTAGQSIAAAPLAILALRRRRRSSPRVGGR